MIIHVKVMTKLNKTLTSLAVTCEEYKLYFFQDTFNSHKKEDELKYVYYDIWHCIPRASEKPNVNEKKPYDHLFIWRIILFTLLLISSIIGISAYIKFQLLESVMNGKRTVVVNFHADWCDPCTVLTPKLIELIEPIETLDLAIINLESNPDLADVFSVKAVPAVFAMSNGLVLEKFIGLQDVGMVEKFVEKLTAQDATNSNIESNSVNLKMDNSVNPKGSDVKS
ncbi:hypothetical protein HZH66_008084 [Vespula vulgaris]|uniref:Thioredoxin domain-containing protein n=1 Tax=Vespula vulgaris TaxID=7454 RepID=A0A834N3Y6_VESVU|nr:hypothetical protein HZH66_008084 [Vespula vulgaris]